VPCQSAGCAPGGWQPSAIRWRANAAGRTLWLNPEPRLHWYYGDSVIAAYERHRTAFECWRTDQLAAFVRR
jgi:hypothetical protein